MRITSKGRVTIPAEIREAAGLTPDTEVECRADGDAIRLARVASDIEPGRGAQAVALLRGCGSLGPSTDEIMAMTRGD